MTTVPIGSVGAHLPGGCTPLPPQARPAKLSVMTPSRQWYHRCHVMRRTFHAAVLLCTLLVLGGLLLNQAFPAARLYLRGVAGRTCFMFSVENRHLAVHRITGWPEGDGGVSFSRHLWIVHPPTWPEGVAPGRGSAYVAMDGHGVADDARLHWDRLVGWEGPMRESAATARIETVSLVLALVPGLWLGIRAVRWLRDRLVNRRRRAGLCLACGYDLRASPGRCPECGRATDAPATAGVPGHA